MPYKNAADKKAWKLRNSDRERLYAERWKARHPAPTPSAEQIAAKENARRERIVRRLRIRFMRKLARLMRARKAQNERRVMREARRMQRYKQDQCKPRKCSKCGERKPRTMFTPYPNSKRRKQVCDACWKTKDHIRADLIRRDENDVRRGFRQCSRCSALRKIEEFRRNATSGLIETGCIECQRQTTRLCASKRRASETAADRAQRNRYLREWYARMHPDKKAVHRLAARMHGALRQYARETCVGSRTMALRSALGLSGREFRRYIELQFKHGMTWANYGKAWHIDHVMPVASIDPRADHDGWMRLWHYTNLRPLWAKENLRKHARITVPAHQPLLLI